MKEAPDPDHQLRGDLGGSATTHPAQYYYVNLATHPADANRTVGFSLSGEACVSDNAGGAWRKIACEFGEIRAAVWVPNSFVAVRSEDDLHVPIMAVLTAILLRRAPRP